MTLTQVNEQIWETVKFEVNSSLWFTTREGIITKAIPDFRELYIPLIGQASRWGFYSSYCLIILFPSGESLQD